MIYTRNTIIEVLSRLLEPQTNADIDKFAMTFEVENYGGTGKTHKVNSIAKYFTGDQVSQDIVTEAVSELLENELQRLEKMNTWYDGKKFDEEYPKLTRLLRQDGFEIVDYKLVRNLPDTVSVQNYESILFTLLDKHNFTVCRGHLEQAIDAHARGEWASANAQLRAFAEGLFNGMADNIYGHRVAGFDPNVKRSWLGRTVPPLFNTELNEMSEDGKNFINGFMKRLHPERAHPGLSNLDDSTFRLHLVILTATHYLKKYDNGVSPAPSRN